MVVRCPRASTVAVGRPASIVDEYVDQGHEERQEIVGGGTRWGSGEAQITGVEVLGDHGRSRSSFRTGDELTIRIHYRSDERIDRPVFGLALENAEGVYVWASNTRDARYVPDSIDGTGSVEFQVPRLPLLPGEYLVLASIVDFTTQHVFDFLRHCARFRVDHGVPRESGGIASLGGSWQGLAPESLVLVDPPD